MNQSFSLSGYSLTDMITCVVDGGDIYQTDYVGNRRHIGKTLGAYQELEETTKQYYDKLVELGVIVPEKTPQEMMAMVAEMQGTMLEMSRVISDLSKKLEGKEPQGNGHEQRADNSGEDVPQRKPGRSGGKGAASDQRDNG